LPRPRDVAFKASPAAVLDHEIFSFFFQRAPLASKLKQQQQNLKKEAIISSPSPEECTWTSSILMGNNKELETGESVKLAANGGYGGGEFFSFFINLSSFPIFG